MASGLRFGPYRFDPEDRRLLREGREVPLPPRALAVLGQLLARPGRIVEKRALLGAAWPDAHVTEDSLAEAVSLLRQALGDDRETPRFIETVHRRGYRFVAGVTADGTSTPAAATATSPAEAAVGEPAKGATSDGSPPTGSKAARLRRRLAAAAALGALCLAAAIAWGLGRQPAAPPVRRLELALPPELALDAGVAPAFALSPRGDRLVFAGRAAGRQQLYLRSLDRFEAVPIPGTAGGAQPFFSPDGEWLGFFAGGSLRKVPVAGGEPVALCPSPYPFGASWGADGWIVFAPDGASGLLRVPAAGGQADVLTVPDAAAGEEGHRWPEVLAGPGAVAFTVWRGGLDQARVEILEVASGRRRAVAASASFPRALARDLLLVARASGFAAVPLDRRRLAPRRAPEAVLDGVAILPASGGAHLALSTEGTLAYLPADPDADRRQVVRAGAGEAPRPTRLPSRAYRNLALSPDGRRLALTIREEGRSDLWVGDLERGTLARLTFDGDNVEPVWAPDGRSLAFAGARGGPFQLHRVPADGSGPPEPLPASDLPRHPGSFSPDGRVLAFLEEGEAGGADLWLLPDDGPARPFVASPAAEAAPRFSPDGRWLAYQSDESGAWEIYVRPFPGPGERWQASVGGGVNPRWAPDGRRLLFRRGPALLAVEVAERGGASVRPGAGVELLVGRPAQLVEDEHLDRFAVAADGSLLFLRPVATGAPQLLRLIQGWSGELRRTMARMAR